jgi:hypothetical protein
MDARLKRIALAILALLLASGLWQGYAAWLFGWPGSHVR